MESERYGQAHNFYGTKYLPLEGDTMCMYTQHAYFYHAAVLKHTA